MEIRGNFNNYPNRFNNPQNPPLNNFRGNNFRGTKWGYNQGTFYSNQNAVIIPCLKINQLLTNLTILLMCMAHTFLICRALHLLGQFHQENVLRVPLCIIEIKTLYSNVGINYQSHHYLLIGRVISNLTTAFLVINRSIRFNARGVPCSESLRIS